MFNNLILSDLSVEENDIYELTILHMNMMTNMILFKTCFVQTKCFCIFHIQMCILFIEILIQLS